MTEETPMTPGPSTGRRPGPIQIPTRSENTPVSTPSPRAALLAGLRQATDRRQRDFLARERDMLAGLPQPSQPYNQSPGSRSPVAAPQSPPVSPAPFYPNSVDPAVEPLYSALYAKQKELMATSMMISQQQQLIQAAMTNAAAMAMVNNGGRSDEWADQNQPGSRGSYGHGYSPSMSGQLGSVGLNDLSGFSNLSLSSSPSYPQADYLLERSKYSGSPGKLQQPPRLFNRPASPSLPVRPLSSASMRGSSSFFNTNSMQGSNAGPPGLASPGQSFESPTAPTAGGFRRGHRKASSLSTSTVYTGSTLGSGPSGLSGPSAMGTPSRNQPGRADYEIPWRQPMGPPPLDDIKNRPEMNFRWA